MADPHVCRNQHGATVTELDVDAEGAPIRNVHGKQTKTTRHTEDVRCHDCGSEMAHPPGDSVTTWVCPRIHSLTLLNTETNETLDLHADAAKLKAGQALECGVPA